MLFMGFYSTFYGTPEVLVLVPVLIASPLTSRVAAPKSSKIRIGARVTCSKVNPRKPGQQEGHEEHSLARV